MIVLLAVMVVASIVIAIVGGCMSLITTIGSFVFSAVVLYRRIKHENLRYELDQARLAEIRARSSDSEN